MQHPSFKECFSSWWREFEGNGWEGHKFMRKLQFVKAKLKDWNKNNFGMLKERKKTILDEIANIDVIEQEGFSLLIFLFQRVDGDCNSKLFHKVANGRRNKNFIKFLENERGLVLDNSESITEEILLYFKKLYSSPPGESWRVEEFHNNGIINQNTNASFIILLPKKSQSKKISDFRPISLITCLYKVIEKVLSGLLGGVLPETIHSTQGAFVQGRQILDAVLIANEIVDEKRRSGEEGVVFKIDFEKAYDHVKWDFLDHVLEKKGFSSKWRIRMRGCLSSVSYAILVNGELEEIILREEIHWRQKAKVKWVKDGDCNSKLLHKVANGRRNKNFIKFLENERGLVLDNSKRIIEEILLYFKKLYSSPLGESWRVEEFHNNGIINQNTNASFIILLPKKSQSKKISDFRPISLITCLYKVIAKVLSGLLGGVLLETIHSTQGAFVQGRQILDAVLIANEIVDEKRRSREEGVVFKIDFEKAYDHVKWDFLDHVLEKKGFSSKWRIRMRGCLSSVSYAILVNGNAKGWVKASKGLRQGDPLSPFLFTIVANMLSRMLLKAEERSLLEGFRVGRNRCRVSHLQFADDTILFANSCTEELQTLKSLLLVFGQVSGLKVNLDKSNLFGINLD
ncbi:LINE-1 retrotransposable element ORF2 protein [Vitis vinifera]|uniref:LINE-1 retrotransposable element ORF2 protein n=1 Tax=Vitis vinifera TaxID=29760 RepID=A0A438ISW4_VITVI|nr:LINE-1 retrotransposable element ORF2 protein [Vitis vinifera]